MIKISHPYIKSNGEETLLCADILDEGQAISFNAWFSVSNTYKEFLCDDRADAFLMSMFMIAMKSRQDIMIDAPVSPRFLFNFYNTIQPLFLKFIPASEQIKIFSREEELETFNGKAVGCGCSLGVDSMSSFLKHIGSDVVPGYQVSHLAVFNTGHFGYNNQEEAELLFRKAVKDLEPFSKEVNMPIVAVDTNLNEYYLKSGFVTIKSRFIPFTLCCVLALQKLFGKYVFASSYSVDGFEIMQNDHSHAEAAFVSAMSTESTEIILSNPCMNRVEKTRFISQHPLTKKYLNVCWAAQQAYGVVRDNRFIADKTKKNCGWCDKCLRTLFTLELLGCDLKDYNEGFDISKYLLHREDYIINVLVKRKNNVYCQEIYDLMVEKGFSISRRIKFKAALQKLRKTLFGLPKVILSKTKVTL